MAEKPNYWSTRDFKALEDEYFTTFMKDTEARNKLIVENFEATKKDIQQKIDSFWANYAKGENLTVAEARKKANSMDVEEYASAARKYVLDKDFTDEANEMLRTYNFKMRASRLELLKAQIDLEITSVYSDTQKLIDQELQKEIIAEYTRQAGILGQSVMDASAQNVARIANASFHGTTWSESIWGKPEHQAGLKAKLNQLLKLSTIERANPRIYAKELEKAFKVSEYNAQRLMASEAARVNTEAKKEMWTTSEFEEYEYYAEPDACPICASLAGKKYLVKDMQSGVNAKPMHPFCRCGSLPVSQREQWNQSLIERGL